MWRSNDCGGLVPDCIVIDAVSVETPDPYLTPR